jgi:hypothetical protein
MEKIDTSRRQLIAAAAAVAGGAALPQLANARTPAHPGNKITASPAIARKPPRQRWYAEYQLRDYEIVDYQRFYVDGCVDVPFRGPYLDPLRAEPGSFFTALGSAHTYGCFLERPYPALLAEAIGMPSLNLGVGGAGPAFYTQYDRLIEGINRSRFVILQCMSARDVGNSRFQPDGYNGYVIDRKTGQSVPTVMAWRQMVTEEPENAVRYAEESRRAWVEQSLALIARIKVPIVLLYFSGRKADYTIDAAAIIEQARRIRSGEDKGAFVDGLMSGFPHLVDAPSLAAVRAKCQGYAECISARGMGHELISRFTGKPVVIEHTDAMGSGFDKLMHMTRNDYYASKEMNEDAAAALVPVVKKLLATLGSAAP